MDKVSFMAMFGVLDIDTPEDISAQGKKELGYMAEALKKLEEDVHAFDAALTVERALEGLTPDERRPRIVEIGRKHLASLGHTDQLQRHFALRIKTLGYSVNLQEGQDAEGIRPIPKDKAAYEIQLAEVREMLCGLDFGDVFGVMDEAFQDGDRRILDGLRSLLPHQRRKIVAPEVLEDYIDRWAVKLSPVHSRERAALQEALDKLQKAIETARRYIIRKAQIPQEAIILG